MKVVVRGPITVLALVIVTVKKVKSRRRTRGRKPNGDVFTRSLVLVLAPKSQGLNPNELACLFLERDQSGVLRLLAAAREEQLRSWLQFVPRIRPKLDPPWNLCHAIHYARHRRIVKIPHYRSLRYSRQRDNCGLRTCAQHCIVTIGGRTVIVCQDSQLPKC